MADSLAETLAEVKRDQTKNLHDLEVLRIRLHLIRLEHVATQIQVAQGSDAVGLAVLRTTEQVVIPRIKNEIKRMEEAAERWKARVKQISELLAWKIKQNEAEDEELQPIHEPVYFV